MFYQGDLQGGISAAVQQSKLVTCFVTSEHSDKDVLTSSLKLMHIR